MDIRTLRHLASPEGKALLREAESGFGVETEFALGSRLRRDHAPELVAAALTQVRLRRRATAKFHPADAARMFLTVDGYEQATRATVASHRARRLADRRPGGRLLDLCCGIGGDLIELARAGLTVTGVEMDELTAEAARLNIAALDLTGRAGVLTGDAARHDRSGYDAVVCDPARRTARGRIFDPDAYQPPWSFVLELLDGDACVKVAPGIPHDRVPAGAEAEWVSDNGEVKEAAIWSGELASGCRRRATVLRGGAGPGSVTAGPGSGTAGSSAAAHMATLTDADDPGDPRVHAPGRFLYEPDGAVIRAGLVTAVAAMTDGWLLDSSIAYVSADTHLSTPFARAYEVTEVLPYDVKALRRYVRAHDIGSLTIKKRGVEVTPEELRRSLRPKGSRTATLVVTRAGRRTIVLVATPL
ncbi:SAM-dependent methyltransferase [Phytoactinopolyspora alkaliphila]|uniref:SAM-dependent methyltransferase n=1 Tax=Phytoactinopolyspora alkaliphila TaxID=1783498 RepID=A0A6N9YHA9_9ACTN|nr:SAM-dependent methyltransferase [Phytoactinopolyspora alkaliphila]